MSDINSSLQGEYTTRMKLGSNIKISIKKTIFYFRSIKYIQKRQNDLQKELLHWPINRFELFRREHDT